jgi:hypothetical protein
MKCWLMSLMGSIAPVDTPTAVAACPLRADSVEKVSKMKLWNQNLKQSNPSKWSFES